MKKMLLMAAMCCLALVACKKENTDPINPGNDTSDTTGTTQVGLDYYVGTYDLLMVCDSILTEGTWFSNEYYGQLTGEPEEDMYGTLAITMAPDGSHVNVLATLDFDGEMVDFYTSTGTIDEQGRLVLATGTLEAPSGVTLRTSFTLVLPEQPLVFKTTTHFDMSGYDFAYLYTNTATKR